jgi:RNA polymerase sigma factor (sigma-70 family)
MEFNKPTPHKLPIPLDTLSPMDDDRIIQWICAGGTLNHDRAIRTFYERWAVQMKAYFVTKGASIKDAEDILQETAVKIWRNAAQYKGQGEARAWMWSIARNALTDHLRKTLGKPEAIPMNGDPDDPDPPAPNPQEETPDDCVEEGLNQFACTDPQRAYALQLWVADVELQDIADRLGRTYGATRQYLTECRKKLKPFVEPCLELLTA